MKEERKKIRLLKIKRNRKLLVQVGVIISVIFLIVIVLTV